MTPRFGRIITAMITPFDDNGDVNFDEAIRIGEYLTQNGTDALLLAGTTGESPTLSHDEEFELFRVMIRHFKGKVPIVVGTGSNATATAIAATQEAEKLGADATLQVVPYYNKPPQEGIYQHFKAIAENTDLPLILYNIPGRTSRNMDPETLEKLARIPNIVAIKESAGSVEQMRAMRQMTPSDFDIYSGDDGLTLDFMAEGACGVISVAAHCVGPQMKTMIDAFVSGHHDQARVIETTLKPLFEGLFVTTNPILVKAAMALKGFSVGVPRLPLVPATETEKTILKGLLDAL
ncbi:MAG: 4-hydroxy-tetrahydrodipicolinate synthase [Candidatus Margulisiibacteriota bacterium]